MTTSIITIGNSKGIRIPKIFLEESGIKDEVELTVKKGEIRIIPVKIVTRNTSDTVLLSEKILQTDWNTSEEEKAWESLQ